MHFARTIDFDEKEPNLFLEGSDRSQSNIKLKKSQTCFWKDLIEVSEISIGEIKTSILANHLVEDSLT